MEPSPKGEPSDKSPKAAEKPKTCLYPPIDSSSQSDEPASAVDVFSRLLSRPEAEIKSRFEDSVGYGFTRHDRGYIVSTIAPSQVEKTRFGPNHFRDVFRPLLVGDVPGFPPVGGPTAAVVDIDLSTVSFKVVDGIMKEVGRAKRVGVSRESKEADPVVPNTAVERPPDLDASGFTGKIQLVPNTVVERPPDLEASGFTGLQGSSLFWNTYDYAMADVQQSQSSIYSDLVAGLENYCNINGLALNTAVRASSAPVSPSMQISPSRCDFPSGRGSLFMTYRPGQGPASGLQRQTGSSTGWSSIPSLPVPFFYQYGPPTLAIPPGAGIQSDRAGQIQAVRQPQVQPRPSVGPPFPIGLQRGGQTAAGLDGRFAQHETPSPQNRGVYSMLCSQNNNVRSDGSTNIPSSSIVASKAIVRPQKRK